MRGLALLLLTGMLAAVDAEPAPATIISTDGAGSSAGTRAADSALAADKAWAAARHQAELQAQARNASAAKNTSVGNDNRGQGEAAEPISPGSLAALAEQDEVALLIELQRRRHRAAGDAGRDLVAAELAASTRTTGHLPTVNGTPGDNSATAHPEDAPHPGPQPPTVTEAPDRPERFPAR
jgi:hypothetical protein